MELKRNHPPSVSLLGEAAILIDGGAEQTSESQALIWGLAEVVSKFEHVSEVSIGVNNLMILFDPIHTDFPRLVKDAVDAWENGTPMQRKGKTVKVPVVYGGEYGIDLSYVAQATGLSEAEVIAIHSGRDYVVDALGAHPGFPYLSGLDPRLSVPRRSSPRLKVEIGSIVVAGVQAGIITCNSASGWHILGRSNLSFFDPSRAEPALFSPGDKVRFVPQGLTS